MAYSISRFILFLIFKVFFRIEVKGREYIPREGGFILACNHVSYLDPPALGIACPRPVSFMAKYELFKIPVLSWWLYSVGVLPLKRESADISALKSAIRHVNSGKGLALFPEGTRQVASNASSKPLAGVGFLAAKLKTPVIPAYIKGSDKALPKGAKFIRPAKIQVYFGKEINIERGMPYQDIAQLIMANIRQLPC
jgi:1-acyl-sn-glycerol-3-phosphate acyltransferase